MKTNKFRIWYNNKMRYDFDTGSYDNIMQFTGMLDKNNKEIYEGDIIVCRYRKMNDKFYEINGRANGIVKFDAENAQYRVFFDKQGYDHGDDWQTLTKNYGHVIVGNIFENKELIAK